MVPGPSLTAERVAAQVAEIVAVFSASDADPAWLLCDRHPGDAVAFTFAEPDGSTADLTFGELRARSQRFTISCVSRSLSTGLATRSNRRWLAAVSEARHLEWKVMEFNFRRATALLSLLFRR